MNLIKIFRKIMRVLINIIKGFRKKIVDESTLSIYAFFS